MFFSSGLCPWSDLFSYSVSTSSASLVCFVPTSPDPPLSLSLSPCFLSRLSPPPPYCLICWQWLLEQCVKLVLNTLIITVMGWWCAVCLSDTVGTTSHSCSHVLIWIAAFSQIASWRVWKGKLSNADREITRSGHYTRTSLAPSRLNRGCEIHLKSQ